LAESAEETQSVRGRSEGKKGGGWPAEEQRDRVGEQSSYPAKISLYAGACSSDECGVAFRSESASEEDREEEKNDSANFAGERRLGRPIVPGPARAL
jgi:hypothetical protein